ncbi:hypothetical protein C2S53_001761 [Perilla frutescens var. hirtella]|uniref:Uncharacterized protein n=1 Tax=Perilla frutescens var. hirtella TaxID=608512 RepID=A0AAD4NYA7_PERFH|nr:hypothetical protein C2S53_001761 [Perilla frutescens var. hirtella]
MVKRRSIARNNVPLFRPVQEMNDFGGTPGKVSDLETCIRMCEQAPAAERPAMYRILQSTITRDPETHAVIGNLTEFSSALMALWELKYDHVNALAEQNPSSMIEPELLRATLNSPPEFQAPCPRAEGTLEARPLIVQDTESLSSRMHQSYSENVLTNLLDFDSNSNSPKGKGGRDLELEARKEDVVNVRSRVRPVIKAYPAIVVSDEKKTRID